MASTAKLKSVAGFPAEMARLVHQFRDGAASYRSASYNETQLRREFLDIMLGCLGWDVNNVAGSHNALKDVIHEDAVRVGGNIKAPDYGIRVGGKRVLFVEAKKPAVNIRDGASPAYQLRRYAWSAKLPLSILTDFEEFAVYDCRIKPDINDKAHTGRLMYVTYTDYEKKWDELHALFSKQAVLEGSLDQFAEAHKAPRGTQSVDSAFLGEIEAWRATLAREISNKNPGLNVRELNTAVQLIIDRIIFLRMAEDRGIEPYGRLKSIADKPNVFAALQGAFADADDRYNSGLFHLRDDGGETVDRLTPALQIANSKLKPILENLYYPKSPYEFSVLRADTLGQVYEQFLGKTITLQRKKAVIEEKPAVRKAGGVYYTPDYIVGRIVRTTLDPLLEGRGPQQVSGSIDGKKVPLRIVDPACGSGSFLIEAYQHLLDWYHERYVSQGPKQLSRGANPKVYLDAAGSWRLTIAERRRILLTHIYGVDVDPQAVEVSKLSLLLKVLEGESGDALASQMDMFHMRALPDLSSNIKCGNSLISSDFFDERPPSLFGDDDLYRINSFDWEPEFPFLRGAGGFGAVVGNPPWVSLSGKFGNDVLSPDEQAYLIEKFVGNTYMPNMYEYFVAKGLSLLRPGGRFGFIVPDRFGKNDQFIGLREKILRDFVLEEVTYRAPFPNVTADTLIFIIENDRPGPKQATRLGEFRGQSGSVLQRKLCDQANRYRFDDPDAQALAKVLSRLKSSGAAKPLGELIGTTSGFGGKSSMITRQRKDASQREVLKGGSITKYRVGEPLYFEFKKVNITGRTTDPIKLGWKPKVLIRKTGSRLIAAYDDSGIYAEQSLYFTYGPTTLDPYYLLGLLNSRLLGYIFAKTLLTNEDSIAQVKKVDLDALPIVLADSLSDSRDRVREVADAAKSITSALASYAIERLPQRRTIFKRTIISAEQKIDRLCYELYGLSAVEVREVEAWSGHLQLKF